MPKTLFVYGTLTFPEVVKALIGKGFQSKPAILNGYSARTIEHKHFPGLIKSRGAITEGFILLDVDDASYRLITDWEGLEYVSTELEAMCEGKKVRAFTFVWTATGIMVQPWKRDHFQKTHLDEWILDKIPAYLKAR